MATQQQRERAIAECRRLVRLHRIRPGELAERAPPGVKLTRRPARRFDARYQCDPLLPVADGFLAEWRARRGGDS